MSQRPHSHHTGCGHIEKLLYSRRELLGSLGGGIAGLAFADLLSRNGLLEAAVAAQTQTKPGGNPLAPKPQQFPAKAKAVISVFCY
jgi:hypothetical protein